MFYLFGVSQSYAFHGLHTCSKFLGVMWPWMRLKFLDPKIWSYLRSIMLHIYAYIISIVENTVSMFIYACMYIYIYRNTCCFLYLRQLLGTGVMHTDPHGGNLLKVEGSVTKTPWRLMVDDFWGIVFDDTYYYGRLENHHVSKYLSICSNICWFLFGLNL